MDQLVPVDTATGRYSVRLSLQGKPGIDTLTQVRIYKKDVGGAWRLFSQSTGGTAQPVGGPFLSVPLPADGLRDVVLEHTLGASQVVLTGVNYGDAVLFDLAGLPVGTAQYRLMWQEQNQAEPSALETGTLQLAINGAGQRTASRTVGSGHAGDAQTARSTSRQRLDRWGNVLEVTDPRNPDWLIRYTYNDNNQLTAQQQMTLTRQADGTLAEAAPVALAASYYDALGREIGGKDGIGNLQRKVYGRDGRVADERHADGGLVHSSYNLFGERVGLKTYTDGANYIATAYGYDHLGQLTSVSTGLVVTYAPVNPTDGGGMQLSDGVLGALTESYRYDELGRRNRTINGAGGISYVRYDHAGNVLANIDEIGTSTRYSYSALGHRTGQQNADGATMRWDVDAFGRVNSHVDLGGATVSYTYDGLGQLTTQTSTARGAIAGQSLVYSYDGDQLVRLDDVTNQQATTYAYDLAGNRLREKTVAKGRVVQDNHIAYDALGRMTRVADSRYDIRIAYDANGNREQVDTYYVDAKGQLTSTSAHNRYDAMNRQTLVDGEKVNGNVVAGARSHSLVYDWAGNRTADSYYADPNTATGYTTETYSYDAAGRLSDTQRDGNLVDRRYYDGAGRIVQSGAVAGESSDEVLKNFKLAREYRISHYDAAGHLLRQKARDLGHGLLDDIYYRAVPDRTDAENAYAGYSSVGNLKGYYVVPNDNRPQTHFKMDYQAFDTYKETLGRALNNGGVSTTSTVYDGNGHIVQVIDNPATGQGEARIRAFVNDAAGQVLLKTDGKVETHMLVVNGVLLGSSSANESDSSFASTYQGTASGNLSAAPAAYVVQGTAETPSSIAQAMWGDSKLWYLIADANSLAGNEALATGTMLRIPARVNTVYNDYQSFKPYSAAEAVGNTTPQMPTPAGRNAGGCGGIGAIVMVVVAVIATIYTAGAAASLFSSGSLAGGFAGGTAVLGGAGGAAGFAAAAVGGAMGSLASQAVGVAIGVQEKINWRGVALSALAAGVSAGLAPGAASNTFLGLTDTAATVARAAVGNAITQGIGVITGLQERFDWRGVAASAAGSFVGSQVGGALKDAGYGKFVQSGLSSFSGGLTAAVARGGRVVIQQIAVDAFGNAIAQSLADMISPTNSTENSTGGATKPISREQVERNTYGGMTSRQLLGGDKDWIGTLGVYDGSYGSDESFPNYQAPIPQVIVNSGNAEQRLNAIFGLTQKNIGEAQAQIQGAEENYAYRFGQGLLGAVKSVTIEPILQVRDMALAGASVAYNEVLRSKGNPMWLPNMRSGIANAYASGTSQGMLLLQSNFVTGTGALTYDATTALMNGRYGDLAEMAGGVVGGFAIGNATQKFGGYGVSVENIGGPSYGPKASQRGSVALKLVVPEEAAVDYSRPSGYRKGVRDAVWNDAIEASTGQVRDPVTGRFMNKELPWDMGHGPGYEFYKHQASAVERGISRTDFLNEHNIPSHYRPELPSSNRSHQGEDVTGQYFGN